MATNIFFFYFFLETYTLWKYEYSFYFTNFAFLLFCLFSLTFRLNFHSVFADFRLWLDRLSIFYQNFNGFLKRGSMRFFEGVTHLCMRRKKNRPKKALFRQNAKKTPFFFVLRLRSTKLKLGLHIYIGQVKFDFELIRTKNKKKMVFFLRSTQFDENLTELFHTC